jgi:hypothetical protein
LVLAFHVAGQLFHLSDQLPELFVAFGIVLQLPGLLVNQLLGFGYIGLDVFLQAVGGLFKVGDDIFLKLFNTAQLISLDSRGFGGCSGSRTSGLSAGFLYGTGRLGLGFRLGGASHLNTLAGPVVVENLGDAGMASTQSCTQTTGGNVLQLHTVGYKFLDQLDVL